MRWLTERRRCATPNTPPESCSNSGRLRNNGGSKHGINQAKKRGKEKHKEGSIGGKEKTHNRTFAEIRTHRAWQASRIHSQKEEKVSQKSLETCVPFVTCEIRIGTSGYHYKHWQGPFYPKNISPDEMLDFYSQHFGTVELNNSFYRLPTDAAFDHWRQSTPANFVFAVKASRFLTHQKKFKDLESALQKLLPRASRLSHKLGPILFQLPPRWQVNPGRLEALLEGLPRDLRCAFEFRDVSWIRPDINKLLARFRAAFCIYELAGYHSPFTKPPTLRTCACTDQAWENIKKATAPVAFGAGVDRWRSGPSIWPRSTSILTMIKQAMRPGMP